MGGMFKSKVSNLADRADQREGNALTKARRKGQVFKPGENLKRSNSLMGGKGGEVGGSPSFGGGGGRGGSIGRGETGPI